MRGRRVNKGIKDNSLFSHKHDSRISHVTFRRCNVSGLETCNNSETIMWKILTGCIKHFNLGRLNIKCG